MPSSIIPYHIHISHIYNILYTIYIYHILYTIYIYISYIYIISHLHLEELQDGAPRDALLLLVAVERVGLARARLAVGEDRHVVAVHGALHQVSALLSDVDVAY